MQKIFSEIEENYKKRFEELDGRRFHFASRLFLWKNDTFSKEKLNKLKAEYIGLNHEEHEKIIENLLAEESIVDRMLFRAQREKYFLKYPMLKAYNKVLFRHLFSKTIYGLDLGDIIEKKIGFEKLIRLKKDLENDPVAIAILSTHAVNFMYGLDYLLKSDQSHLDPDKFLEIAKDEKLFEDLKLKSLKLYLLTHCIIGESVFYSKKILKNLDVYLEMISLAEKEILENFKNISIDNKFEFLVCAKMCGIKSQLEEAILKEANLCYNKEKCIVFEKNKQHTANIKNAEHRNVLAIMFAYNNANFDNELI
ncbi:MAG: hypothetical protein ACD_5C00179G0001 [uncultured bacterium]|nr:MAG: hypothetical protein ACD_5C00179G0001 [uncultured bacterium]